jgi:chromosomal replication initiator protein
MKKNRKPISPYIFPGLRHTNLPVDIAKQMVARIKRDPLEINEAMIMEIVSSVTDLPADVIGGPRRDIAIVDARRIYIFNVKRYLKKSYVYIGKSLGNRDHTTITFSIKKYHALYATDAMFRRMADVVTNRIEFY